MHTHKTTSGLFSGLTLGLMGLDIHALEVVTAGKDEDLAHAARVSAVRSQCLELSSALIMMCHVQQIIPVRRNGNLLLCTLLFGNVAVISMTVSPSHVIFTT